MQGPGGRLGLLSPGFAKGGGVCWARLTPDRATRKIVAHTSGLTPIRPSSGENEQIAEQVKEWAAVFEAKCKATLGRVAHELPLPDKQEQLGTFSAVHLALSRPVLQELRFKHPELLQPSDTIVVCNRYSAVIGLNAGQEVTLGLLLELRRYDSKLICCQLSVEWLRILLD